MSLKHVHTVNPVTALEFYTTSVGTRLLLAAEGCYLKVFNAANSQLVSQCEIFQEQTIHGIAVNRSSQGNDLHLVIWGGTSLILLSKFDFEHVLYANATSIAFGVISVSDWILDAAIWESSCVLVTAHNALLRADFDKNGQPTVEDLPSPSESILYSAHVVWDTPKQILVAAGTVFGEIIYWRGSISENGSFGDVQTLFTFTGHEGSIFGVNISPVIVGPGNTQTRFLASCSDDRAIRIWDLDENTEKSGESAKYTLRETGFGENERDEGTSLSGERCLAMVMGHASRIWGVKFLIAESKDLESPLVNILSLGEDSTAQQWSLELAKQKDPDVKMEGYQVVHNIDSEPAAKLGHIDTYAFHSGKHIWSSAFMSEGNGLFHIANGGADGKISKYDIEVVRAKTTQSSITGTDDTDGTENDVSQSVWDLEEVLSRLPLYKTSNPTSQPVQEVILSDSEPTPGSTSDEKPPKKKKKAKKIQKDAFNRYAFVTKDTFIATTAFGRVLTCQLGLSMTWNEIFLPQSGRDDLRAYSIVEGFPELSMGFLAGANGVIYSYQPGSAVKEMGKVDGKVADMFKVYNKLSYTHSLLVTTLSTKVATLFTLNPALGEPFRYHLPEDFVVTAAASFYNGMLLLGSRKGSLAVFHPLYLEHPICTWNDQRFSSGDSFTSIRILPPSGEGQEKIYMLTTGRNGVYSIFSVEFFATNEEITGEILPVHCGTPSFGPMIEEAWFEHHAWGDLVLYGFKSKNFVVWNETKQYEITSVECGGAHRSYAYSALKDSGGAGHFVYTKASKLYIHSQAKPSHEIVKQGGHGREIKTTAISSDKKFIATGAEDTAIRIWRYQDDKATFETNFNCLAVVQSHTAGIQYLQWHNSHYLLSSGGNEEFFIWSISEIPRFGVGVICEATCPDPSPDQDLRIMSFDVTACPLALCPDGQESLLISLAYSDSTIRCYVYNKWMGYLLIGTGNYTSSCLTQIHHLDIRNETLSILTASTDGRIPIWNLPLNHQFVGEDMENSFHPSPPRLEMLSTSKIHQNAVKSLDFVKSKGEDYFLVATGGDDNALAISIYQTLDMSSKPRTFILRAAHAAAITGVAILPGSVIKGGRESFRVVSSSNDQRVKEWEVSVSKNDDEVMVEIKNTGDVFTSVADVGDLAILNDGLEEGNDTEGKKQVLIVGNGMEVWGVSGTT